MFKRLNLAKFGCDTLSIAFHVKLSPDVAERILAGSHSHKMDGKLHCALYGSVYTAGKARHGLRAYIEHAEGDEYHVESEYMRREVPKPPRDVKSVRKLAEALQEQPQVVTVECDAQLSYDEKSGWRSVLEIPMPISPADEAAPFSHIEAVRLSKRERDQVSYSVQVRWTKAGQLRHSVSFVWEGALSEGMPERLLERSVQLSRLLLRRQEEEAGGHGS